MKKIAYCIGWFVDKVIISALLLLIWLPYSIFILPIGIFNPFKRKHFYWIYDPGVIGTDDLRCGLICLWLIILFVFTFLFCFAPILTSYFLGSIIAFVLLVYCYHEYKLQELEEKCKRK